jgi:hypothetical protein
MCIVCMASVKALKHHTLIFDQCTLADSGGAALLRLQRRIHFAAFQPLRRHTQLAHLASSTIAASALERRRSTSQSQKGSSAVEKRLTVKPAKIYEQQAFAIDFRDSAGR